MGVGVAMNFAKDCRILVSTKYSLLPVVAITFISTGKHKSFYRALTEASECPLS